MLRTRQHVPHKKIKFTPEEDELLKNVILKIGTSNWVTIASMVPGRNVKQCKERWENHVAVTLNEQEWAEEEDTLLVEKYKLFGKQWAKILPFFNGRTLPQIKRRIEIIIKDEPIPSIIEKNLQQVSNIHQDEPVVMKDEKEKEQPVTLQEVKKPSPLLEILSSLGFELNSDQDEAWEREFVSTLDLTF